MALTVDQLAAELESIGEELPRSLGDSIMAAAMLAQEEIKSNAPVDTGALRDSIKLRVIDDQFLGIAMANYGFFQNYGVAGTSNSRTQFGVPETVSSFLPPRTGDTYSFDPAKKMIGGDLPFGVRVAIHRNGLNGQNFFNLELVVDRIAELVNQNLEL